MTAERAAAAPRVEPRPESDPAARYRERRERFEREAAAWAARGSRLSATRGTTFLFGLLALIGSHDVGGRGGALLALAAGGLGVAFIALVRLHRRARARQRWFEALAELAREGLARLERAWDALPARGPAAAPQGHPYAVDLDVFGHGSLWRLLSSVSTAPGREALARWLLGPAPPDVVRARQAAVAELAPRLELRDELAAHGRLAGEIPAAVVDRFTTWAAQPPWLTARPALLWTTRLLPALAVALGAAAAAGAVPSSLWLYPLGAGFVLRLALRRRIDRSLAGVSAADGRFQDYVPLLAALSAARFDAPLLRDVQDSLSADGRPAVSLLRRLRGLVHLADTRLSPMLHGPLQFLTMWDFHVAAAIEHLRDRIGAERAARWADALGTADGLAALAALRHDHPDWCLPVLIEPDEEGGTEVRAEALGHPLIPPGRCVRNDVTVGPPGTFLLVTGSNMSGKSTLLRAIGTNLVLAQAGGPACARSLRMPAVQVHSSVRVEDSLEAGISRYMAELRRLKSIVDAADAARREGRRLVYLIDEMLQGTNTEERQIAARRILAHLLQQGAIGTVTTHDLALAEAAELAGAARAVHFTETLHPDGNGPPMTFDYRLRPGLATSTNALVLLELIGLG